MRVLSLVQIRQLNHQNALIIITVMILIALAIILATAAFVQNDELSEDHDTDEFSMFPNWGAIFFTVSFLLTLFRPMQWMGVYVEILCAADLGGGILAPP